VHHSIAAGEVADAAELIANHWGGFLQQGRLGTVVGWLDAMPPAAVATIPGLCLTRAWLAVNLGQLEELDRWIDAAERAIRAAPESPETASLEAAAAMLRCVHRYMAGDVAQAVDAAHWALEREPDESSPWRSVGCPVLGLALFWSGEDQAAAATLQAALPRSREAANHLAVVHALGGLAAIHVERGALDEAEEFAARSLALSREWGLDEHWAASLAHVVQGRVRLERGDPAGARELVSHALDLSQRGLARVEATYALLTLAQVALDGGERGTAVSLLRLARRRMAECPDPGILRSLLGRTEQVLDASTAGGLTAREQAVLREVAAGQSDAAVAKQLHLSERTVHAHLRSIYSKLDVRSRTAAVRLAQEQGLLR
jgi:LuxR family maltose regulon positive regulatory protein